MKFMPKHLNEYGDTNMNVLSTLKKLKTKFTGCKTSRGSDTEPTNTSIVGNGSENGLGNATITSNNDSSDNTTISCDSDDYICDKPVIYIYAKEDNTPVDISIKLNSGKIYSLYPQNQNILGDNEASWSVLANKDGTLVALESGRELYSLYWEGTGINTQDIKTGYCVAGKDTEEFLYNALKSQGLTDIEAEEFIIFWLPKMQYNKYNLISFDNTLYNKETSLEVSENVDTMLRIHMRFKSSDKYIELEPETYKAPDRNGFTVVEWGGTELK